MAVKSVYFSLGLSLRLRDSKLQEISQKYPSECDHQKALKDVLLLWLRQEYNVKRFGQPTWRMLVEAVNKETGGDDHELAKKIASDHPRGLYS